METMDVKTEVAVLEVIATYDDKWPGDLGNHQDIFKMELGIEILQSEAAALFAVMDALGLDMEGEDDGGEAIKHLIKLSFCLYADECPDWIRRTNGKYYFDTPECVH